MHARYYRPLFGRFFSPDPVMNIKRATRQPQNWNRYAYSLDNPLRFVDPTGEDISVRIRFDDSITPAERLQIIAMVKAWYEKQGAGTANVFDGAKAKHGGNFISRLWTGGYATIKVTGETSSQHTPGTVYAGNFRGLSPEKFANSVSNSILHETAVHQFGVTPVNVGDTGMFARDGGWRTNESISSRFGTVADPQAFADPDTRGNVTDGPIPVHTEDAATIARELGPLQVGPPQ